MPESGINMQTELLEEDLMAQQAAQAAMEDSDYTVDQIPEETAQVPVSEVQQEVQSDVSGDYDSQYQTVPQEESTGNSLTQMVSELTDGLQSGGVSENGMTNGLTASTQADTQASSNDRIAGIALTGAEATLIGTLGSKLTGNKLLGTVIGIGGTLILQKMDKLPDSMDDVKNLIGKVSDFFQQDGREYSVADNGTNSQQTDTSVLQQTVEDFQQPTGNVIAEMGMAGVSDISQSMYQNGSSMAASGTFQVAASMDESSKEALRSISDGNMAQLKAQVAGLVGEDGMISEDKKADVVAELKALCDGYSSYSTGAAEMLASTYGVDSEEYQMGMMGLSNVMQQEAGPLYETMQKLDAQYGLFSEEDLEYFQSVPVVGVPSYGQTGYESSEYGTSEYETSGQTGYESSSQTMDGMETPDTTEGSYSSESSNRMDGMNTTDASNTMGVEQQSQVEIPSYFEEMTQQADAQSDMGLETP